MKPFFHTAVFLALLVTSTLAGAERSWVAPSGFQDPENKWASEAKAYDASSATYASDQCNRVGNGPWLVLTYAQPIRSNQVQVNADFGYGIVDAVAVEALVGAAWTPLYSGPVQNVTPTVISFPSLTTSSFRFRFHYLKRGYYFWLYDFRAFSQPITLSQPVVAARPATSVTHFSAVLHGDLASDGGDLCRARFAFQAAGAAGPTYTAWQGGLSTGQGANAVLTPVAGLTAGTTYTFWMEASNSQGTLQGPTATFTPTALVPGAADWVSPSSAQPTTIGAMFWIDALAAIDDDSATAARCYHPLYAVVGGPALTMDLPTVPIDQVRLQAGRNAYIKNAIVALRAVGSTTWTPLYNGAFTDRAWLTLAVPPGVYAQARVSFTTTITAVGTAWELFGFQAHTAGQTVGFAAADPLIITQPGRYQLSMVCTPTPTALPITLTLASAGDAVAGTDWRLPDGPTLTIPAGAATAQVAVDILPQADGSTVPRTLTLRVANAQNAVPLGAPRCSGGAADRQPGVHPTGRSDPADHQPGGCHGAGASAGVGQCQPRRECRQSGVALYRGRQHPDRGQSCLDRRSGDQPADTAAGVGVHLGRPGWFLVCLPPGGFRHLCLPVAATDGRSGCWCLHRPPDSDAEQPTDRRRDPLHHRRQRSDHRQPTRRGAGHADPDNDAHRPVDPEWVCALGSVQRTLPDHQRSGDHLGYPGSDRLRHRFVGHPVERDDVRARRL
jgi:hypothetical protein